MTYKIVMAMLIGFLNMLLLDFFFFLGIKLNYLDALEIKEYYNVLFADNQNVFIFIIGATVLGFFMVFLRNVKYKASLFLFGWAVSALTLINPIGYAIGEELFMKKNQDIKMVTRSFLGDIMYEGRKELFVRFKGDDTITKVKKGER